jgi:bifunctional non-homologous end joining protein LigD
MAFDLLYADERDLTTLSYQERRERLEAILVPSDILRISPAVIGDGVALYRAAAEQHLEGVMAKTLTSTYQPGARSRDWVKIKTSADADVVIVGWSEGSGMREGTIGSLAMAMYDDGELRYVGQVGTGFKKQTLGEIMGQLEELGEGQRPFGSDILRSAPELRRTHWVPPRLVATVEYRQVTSAGRLRSPSFKGFREDKLPEQCTFDQLRP